MSLTKHKQITTIHDDVTACVLAKCMPLYPFTQYNTLCAQICVYRSYSQLAIYIEAVKIIPHSALARILFCWLTSIRDSTPPPRTCTWLPFTSSVPSRQFIVPCSISYICGRSCQSHTCSQTITKGTKQMNPSSLLAPLSSLPLILPLPLQKGS